MNYWEKINDIKDFYDKTVALVPKEFWTKKRDYGPEGRLVDYLVSRVELPVSLIADNNDPNYLFTEITASLNLMLEICNKAAVSCREAIDILINKHGFTSCEAEKTLITLYKLRILILADNAEAVQSIHNDMQLHYKASALPMEILYSYINKKHGIPYMFAPSKFTFVVTNKCNARCKTCYRGKVAHDSGMKYKKELTTTEIFRVIDFLKLMGTDRIKFLGGEPFCREDIFELLDYAHEANMITELSTNGLLLTEDSYINRIKRLNRTLFHLQISLDGMEKGQNEQRTGAEFELIKRALDKLKAAGIEFTTNTIVSRVNMDEMEDFIEFISGYRIFSRFQIMKACGAGAENFKDIPSPAEKKQIIESIDMAAKRCKARISNAVIFHPFVREAAEPHSNRRAKYHRCRSCTYGMSLSPEGYALPCEFLEPFTEFRCDNVKDKNILDIWQQSPIFKMFRYVPVKGKCESCEYSFYCEMGCFAETYGLTHDIASSDPVCWYEPMSGDVYFPDTNHYIQENCEEERQYASS